ncbi:glycosyl hydrolase [Penicillium riverlandense]|uniref:glycosyl hydrolase n=1 Tax=Penicillium riverlandense TaxID=1903569 RepID=UPI002546A6E9|nr:glycosyl hydrolase [Penicillium riverlandense]KAJ5812482.1 glycosyl hydrolase [Penicillium riverlandense]
MTRPNPVLPGFNPDPSITRASSDFFLATSSFEYFPGVPIYHSKDLIQWKLIGHALTRRSQIHIAAPEPGGGVWAPTLRYHDNMFYLATSSFDRFRPQQDERTFPRGFYIKTANIWDSSSWSDPVYFDMVGFDQDLFWEDDGSVYLSTTHVKVDRSPDADKSQLDFAIHTCKINLETGDSISKPVMIRESPSGIAEGSHIFRRGGYYYLLTAEGGTGSRHSVWVFRSEHGILGPWTSFPNNPLLSRSTDHEVQNTGHADFVEDANGQWWAVLLGVRPIRKSDGVWQDSVFGRETFLVRVQWIDEWPIINRGQKICVGPEPETHSRIIWRDDFSEPSLKLGWYRKNTAEKVDSTMINNPSRLRLHGGPYNLSLPASPTLFLRKQTHRFCVWETKLSFHPTAGREEAGSVVWWNYLTYSSIGIRKVHDGTNGDATARARLVRFRSAECEIVERRLRRFDSDVVLLIRCNDSEYEFGFKELDATGNETLEPQWLGKVSNKVMTRPPPIGLAFSGMLLGLYAFADFRKCTEPADFHYAEFRLRY